MEEILPPDVSPAPTDLGLTNELTLSNSEPSSLTHENLKDICNQNANRGLGDRTAWTNEKHSSYLDSLEASFINQLHHSKGLLSWCSEQTTCDPNLSRQLPAKTRDSSDQFMVLQDGCLRKINFERSQLVLDAHGTLHGRQIQNFGCAGKRHTTDMQQHGRLSCKETSRRGKGTFSDRLVANLEQLPICHQYHLDSVGNVTEVSDQNFVDEDRKGKSSRPSTMAKRLKIAAADTSSKYQILPQSSSV